MKATARSSSRICIGSMCNEAKIQLTILCACICLLVIIDRAMKMTVRKYLPCIICECKFWKWSFFKTTRYFSNSSQSGKKSEEPQWPVSLPREKAEWAVQRGRGYAGGKARVKYFSFGLSLSWTSPPESKSKCKKMASDSEANKMSQCQPIATFGRSK